MSNKTIFQEKNSRLNSNNNDLTAILETINNLPTGEVEVTLQEKTITPTTSNQTITPDENYDGLSKVTINGVTSAIDSDIKATNIRKGIDILGVTGTMEEYVEPKLQSKSATPSTSSQTITPDSSYDGLSSVSVGAVTSSIDSNITASNIKSGVSILGVEGTLEEGITPSGTLEITENGTYDVTEYASASVNVASSSEDVYEGLLNNTITKIDSNIKSLVAYACRGLSKLKTVNLPNATSIGTYAFYYCTSMTKIEAPKVTSLGTYSFYNCGALTNVNFPVATGIGQNTFYSCDSLEIADFGVAGTINQAGFAYCSNLKTLILRKTDTICKLATATNAFQGSAIANGTGYVYVPDELVEEYKVATNWSNYASQIKPLSELEE